jgi:hypothetical protein
VPRTLLLAVAFAGVVTLAGAAQALAAPTLTLTTANGGTAAQWQSLASQGFSPPEWGYKVAVSNLPRNTAGRKTDYFEVARGSDPQTYAPLAQTLKFVPKEGKVYIGVGALAAPGELEPIMWSENERWSDNEVLVSVTGTKVDTPPNSLSTTASDESAQWSSVGLNEWGYLVAVSNLPRSYEGAGRVTRYFPVRRGADPQIFTPVVAELGFTPIENKVYVGVGTMVVEGEEPASYTASEVALTLHHAELPPTKGGGPEEPPKTVTLAPMNMGAPAVSGTPIVGDYLTGSPGTWDHEPTAYAFQWQLCDAAGAVCNDVSGAAGTAFPLTPGDVGHRLRIAVVASNAGGMASAVSAPSTPVGSRVQAAMEWTFGWSSSYTVVESLQVTGVPAGGVVEVACRGGGCPFASVRVTPSARSKACRRRRCQPSATTQVDVAHLFKGRHLHAGAVISVRIVKAGWVGRVYLFTVRANRPPHRQIACLAPGSVQPGRGC